ncbi:M55 family metallopeptidase [Trinickia caryophylli]|uniref:D-aminopeptidase DppA. Metallo peptidase. MEROPS family M55 n=1 Tax=Trinickia caryophylli TaxID=28094 RepID=A0A1X7H8Z3_TRICW|nr:M55 family metallopeptidase [Trinickia caryophylli]PMS09020.1 aminopeptidase [Trinickia caryophylli]TRX14851.1 M55 family metallopeptidase [Trinickia caryophylli]WQE14699.1 M55 family metallopeptidase [Trinickia caryophylli]SMF81903.1 D-aminopeptidase DppA. Metallo peptidase. MEROPS family M55 [Trinickia caryophylli]GLU31873.1 peptidase [Trinickia caryophylli]
MKVLISTDIEGIAGVFHAEQTRPGNAEYERARRWMTEEANAAIAGAFAGGATQVWVNDSHGSFRNLLVDLLDERARVVLGKPRTLGMMAGLENTPALVFMIGYHARSKTEGILAHTINSFAFARVKVDGAEVGEAELYGALAAERGARVALLSGDDVFVEQARAAFPEAAFVTTKSASGHSSGTTDSLANVRAAISAAAREAVAQGRRAASRAIPVRAAGVPIACELQVQSPALADLFAQWPTIERAGAETLRFPAPTSEHVVRTLNCLSAMSFMLR